MTPRSLAEWIGRTPDSKVPDSVWLRVLDRHGWKCAGPCNRPAWAYKGLERDHIIPLINWAPREGHGNRESNLQPLCELCHTAKTRIDVAAKAVTARLKKMRPAFTKPESDLARKWKWAKQIKAERKRNPPTSNHREG